MTTPRMTRSLPIIINITITVIAIAITGAEGYGVW